MKEVGVDEFREITSLIYSKYNYDFSNYALSSFKRRIIRILDLHKFKSIQELIFHLKEDSGYFDKFLSELTVNVTEMFRDPTAWVFLRKHVLSELFDSKDEVNIWHAGCSTGEEVYALAIVLKELGVYDRVNIVASDIDVNVLLRAKNGVFALKDMKINERNYQTYCSLDTLNAYYTVTGETVKMDRDLLERVSFVEHNLVSRENLGGFDLVLCRNVLIYFNQILQNEVLKLIHLSLYDNGYLMIGSKESLMWCDQISKFKMSSTEEKIYQKLRS